MSHARVGGGVLPGGKKILDRDRRSRRNSGRFLSDSGCPILRPYSPVCHAGTSPRTGRAASLLCRPPHRCIWLGANVSDHRRVETAAPARRTYHGPGLRGPRHSLPELRTRGRPSRQLTKTLFAGAPTLLAFCAREPALSLSKGWGP